jgi:hypothetical protein
MPDRIDGVPRLDEEDVRVAAWEKRIQEKFGVVVTPISLDAKADNEPWVKAFRKRALRNTVWRTRKK